MDHHNELVLFIFTIILMIITPFIATLSFDKNERLKIFIKFCLFIYIILPVFIFFIYFIIDKLLILLGF